MCGERRPEKGELIGVASGWETFLRWSNTMLLAAGIESEQLIIRDSRLQNWQNGLDSCAFVIADSLTAKNFWENMMYEFFG